MPFLNYLFWTINVIIECVVIMKIYLINGESYLLVNEQVNEIVKNNKNITVFDLGINTIEDVLVEAGYFSMFQEEKYIIIRNANFFGSGKLKDNENELLLKYFENPNMSTTMIFICNEKIDSRKKVTKILKDKYKLIAVPTLKYYEIENKVLDYFKKNGYKIDNETVKYIVQNGLNNYDMIMMEVEKIMLYYKNSDYIKYEDVVKIVAKSINTNNFLFVDAVVDNDLEKSLEYLNDLKIMKVEPTVLLALLARDFRIMLNVKKMQEQNIREYEMMNELGLQDWQLDKYIKKIFTYKVKELENILIKLANLDLDIKSGKVDKYMGLELFTIDICE